MEKEIGSTVPVLLMKRHFPWIFERPDILTHYGVPVSIWSALLTSWSGLGSCLNEASMAMLSVYPGSVSTGLTSA